jgi:hypothetical protein
MQEKTKRKKLTPEEIEAGCTNFQYDAPSAPDTRNLPKSKITAMRDEKMWTYSENKLLDQITKEIMHAWKDDLIMMRSYYSEQSNISREIKDVIRRSQVYLFDLKGEIFELTQVLQPKKPWYKRLWKRKS